MSDLQRRIQAVATAETKRRSRPSSRPSSKQSSRSSSRLGSRIHSDDEDEYTSSNFLNSANAEVLADSLDDVFLSSTPSEGAKVKDQFTESIDVLEEDRRSSPLEARERALLVILSVITLKYEPQRFTDHLIDLFIKVFKNSKSNFEAMLALQALCVAAAATEEADGQVGSDQIASLVPKIFSIIENEQAEVTTRAHMVMGYAVLQFFTLYGSGAFQVDDTVAKLLDVAMQSNDTDDSAIASAAILGAGLLSTTPPNSNNLIEEMLPTVIELLDRPSTEIRLAAGKVIGLYVQNYQYPDDTDEIPFIDYHELTQRLREITFESSKKISKRDKREQKSLFRDVLKTVIAFSKADSREALRQEDLVITHLKLARSKSLAIDSWNKLLVVQMFRWLYGPGIHTMCANNTLIKEAVTSASLNLTDATESFDYIATPQEEEVDSKKRHEMDDVSRSRQLRARRLEKQLAQIGVQ